MEWLDTMKGVGSVEVIDLIKCAIDTQEIIHGDPENLYNLELSRLINLVMITNAQFYIYLNKHKSMRSRSLDCGLCKERKLCAISLEKNQKAIKRLMKSVFCYK